MRAPPALLFAAERAAGLIKHAREIGQAATLVVEVESVAFEMLPIKRKRTGIDSTGALRALRFRNPIITS